MDFSVVEMIWDTPPMGIGGFPNWEPFSSQIVSLGRSLRLVLCQNLDCSPKLIREDINGCQLPNQDEIVYLILSIRHIALCQVSHDNNMKYTRPEPFFDGSNAFPSDRAIELLLTAQHDYQRTRQNTLLHKLPIEIQDMILYSKTGPVLGPIEAGMLGCALHLGTPFSWRDSSGGDLVVSIQGENKHPEPLRPTWYRAPSARRAPRLKAVAEHIYFGDHFSGLQYQVASDLEAQREALLKYIQQRGIL